MGKGGHLVATSHFVLSIMINFGPESRDAAGRMRPTDVMTAVTGSGDINSKVGQKPEYYYY